MKSVLSAVILLLILFADAGVAQEPSWISDAEVSKVTESGLSPTIEMETLSRIEKSPGNYVIWLYDSDEDRIQIGVAATFPNKPLVATEFVRAHDPIEVFLAVADLDEEVPELLASRAPREAIQKSFDRRQRQILKFTNEDDLAHLQDFNRVFDKGQGSGDGGCDPNFRGWVSSVFGSTTCGNPAANGNVWISTPVTYCNEEASGGACDYDLGVMDRDECVPSLSFCFRVQGDIVSRRQRTADFSGNIIQVAEGHWAHYGAANCAGDGDIQFFTQRGNQEVSYSVPVGHMMHNFTGQGGVWRAPEHAAEEVTYGAWDDGIPASGGSYKLNKAWFQGNGAAGDRAIYCGDIHNRQEMTDVTKNNCHNGEIILCTGADCDSACYSCDEGGCG